MILENIPVFIITIFIIEIAIPYTSRGFDYLYFCFISFFPNSFPPHSPTILPDIDPIVGVDLDVAAVGGQEEVEDVVAVELGDATPAVATHSGSLQLPVVVGVDAVDETAYLYCLRHGSIVFCTAKIRVFIYFSKKKKSHKAACTPKAQEIADVPPR